MKNHVHRHLDGDDSAELGPDDRREADDWDRMVATFRTHAPHASAPPWIEQRVMAEIERLPERSFAGRMLAWLVLPKTVRVPPLALGLVTAALAALLLLPGTSMNPDGVDGPSAPDAVVYVQFMLEAPTATSVAVAGDFSEWEPSFTLEDSDGDGVWTGRVPIQPGVHSYMFLIDGTEWETDPRADRYQDDGFGNRNAVLAVAAGV